MAEDRGFGFGCGIGFDWIWIIVIIFIIFFLCRPGFFGSASCGIDPK
jgi:hypothetical protein